MKNRNKKIKVGIVGCGAIGATLSLLLKKHYPGRFKIVALCDIDSQKAHALKNKIKSCQVSSLKELIALSDLVVEAASAKVSFDVAQQVLRKGKNVLIMSVGGILGKEKKLFSIAEKYKGRIHFPSGAICGLDGIASLNLAGFEEITLKTFKSPAALKGADYVIRKKIDLEGIKKETIIFKGTAQEAVRAFPQNINIVALLSIAAKGKIVPQVEIVVCPGLKRNVHSIEVKSKAAHLTMKCENVPSPDNPKTSYLAILSAVATMSGMGDVFRIGA
ncbi:MAG: aspartate dehydrogenase [Candidatus Omnitrophota bacterium]